MKHWPLAAIVTALIVFSAAALRADGGVAELERLLAPAGLSPSAVVKQMKRDEALRLTSNKDEIIRLDRDAASVIVNNPEHASVMLDSPRLLIVMPRRPGATSFSVLDRNGDVILKKDVIVTNVQPQYVRVRRMCAGNDPACVPAAYYYCPDGCYEISPVTGAAGNIPPPAAPGTAALMPQVQTATPEPQAAPQSAPVILDQAP